ncbi:hypothetical protein BGP_4808 [Beggiatoa sp. PS]|nr:hypothetical protein BGP_4808 [Beggiatoa sp. PS]
MSKCRRNAKIMTNQVVKWKANVIQEKDDSTDISTNQKQVQVSETTASAIANAIIKGAELSLGNSYKVIIDPETKALLKAGKYSWDGTSATIRDAETNKIVKQIKVKSSFISNALTIAIREIQFARIMTKLDSIESELKEINFKIDAEQKAKLYAALDGINEYLQTGEKSSIEHAKISLKESAYYFKDLFEKEFETKPKKGFVWNLLEIYTFRMSQCGRRDQLEDLSKIMLKASKYFFYYFLAMVGNVAIYQILGDTSKSNALIEDLLSNFKQYEADTINKLRYYFKHEDENTSLSEIQKRAKQQGLINNEIENSLNFMEERIKEQDRLLNLRMPRIEITRGE